MKVEGATELMTNSVHKRGHRTLQNSSPLKGFSVAYRMLWEMILMSMALLDVCCPSFVADVSIFMIVLTMFGVIIFEGNDESTPYRTYNIVKGGQPRKCTSVRTRQVVPF